MTQGASRHRRQAVAGRISQPLSCHHQAEATFAENAATVEDRADGPYQLLNRGDSADAA